MKVDCDLDAIVISFLDGGDERPRVVSIVQLPAVFLTTAATAAAAAIATTAAAAAFFFRAGFVNVDRPAVDFTAVERVDCIQGFAVVAHFDESKAFGLAGISVLDDADAIDSSVCFKQGSNRVFRRAKAEVPNKDILQFNFFLKFAERRMQVG